MEFLYRNIRSKHQLTDNNLKVDMAKATLIINDEVNVKIAGLDLIDRRKLVTKFKYEVPYARNTPAYKLGRWDGKIAFFQLGGMTYINLLPEIIPELISAGYTIEVDDRRDYQVDYKFDLITEDTYSNRAWPNGHPIEGQPIMFRDYQVAAVNQFLSNLQSIQEISTGAGKTIMTAALSERVETYGRSLIIVPNRDLVTQTYKDYVNMGLDVGVFFGGQKEYNKTHTICTWQSLHNLMKMTQNGEADITFAEFIDGIVAVIVDEVQSAKSDVLKNMLSGPLSRVPIRWGLTGTIPKEDFNRLTIECNIGSVVNQIRAVDLQEQGMLAKCNINIMQLVENVEYKTYQDEQKYLLTNSARLEYLSELISAISVTGNTLILVDRIATGKELESLIPGSVFVSGGTKSAEREKHYSSAADNDNLKIISTYGVAAVGINIPRIFNMVLIEPGKSFVRVIQSIGRGIRIAKDKDHVEIWDITSTCKFSKRHLTKRKAFYKDAQYPFKIEKILWQL
jgi:superfamily II DNA or RNA helicase